MQALESMVGHVLEGIVIGSFPGEWPIAGAGSLPIDSIQGGVVIMVFYLAPDGIEDGEPSCGAALLCRRGYGSKSRRRQDQEQGGQCDFGVLEHAHRAGGVWTRRQGKSCCAARH